MAKGIYLRTKPAWNKGLKYSPLQLAARAGKMPKGSQHHAWKGDEVGYRSLHYWVENRLGRPNYCEHCKDSSSKKRYDWANVSGEYKREVSDWMRLCRKCHYKYDHGDEIAS